MKRLEQTILKNLIYNEDFTRKVLPFIRADYFSDNKERIVFKEIFDFVNKYKNLPTHESLVINFTESKSLTEVEVRDSIELLNEMHLTKEEKVENKWLVEQTEKFCQDKAIYNAIMESVAILDDKRAEKPKGEIPKLLSDALGISFDQHIGHDYMSDYESRFDFYHKVESRVKFDLDIFNKITKGGLPTKTLNIALAGTGVGKSLFMCHVAGSCLSQGQNVLYITMEMAEERIAERIDANLLNIDLNELQTMTKTEYERKFKVLQNKAHGKLIIKEYPTACASTLHFRALLSELHLKKNFVPNIIFIDYLNICASSRIKAGGSVNSYQYIKSIAEELRGMAVEHNVPIVSATQTNRSGFCLDLDTKVLTKFGTKLLKDVIVGDELACYKGYNMVKTVFPIQKNEVYKIRTKSGKEIICSGKHKFPVGKTMIEKSIDGGLMIGEKLKISLIRGEKYYA